MKFLVTMISLSLLSGCIINRASIQQDINQHYVEIYGGAFTTDNSFAEELKDFTKYICGENTYSLQYTDIVRATNGSLPGMDCKIQGCALHLIKRAKLMCDQTPSIEIIPKEENSRWLDKISDKSTIESLLNSDNMTKELIASIGVPDAIYFNGNKENIWLYLSKNMTVFFEKSLTLTGYNTLKMVLKYGQPRLMKDTLEIPQ